MPRWLPTTIGSRGKGRLSGRWARPGAVVLAVVPLFGLAYLSPVETVGSDSAIALLVSQSILDHGTLGLEVWRDEPDLAYDLDRHRLLEKRGDSVRYYAVGVPLLSVPAVWLANRFGFHMLRQKDEFALQNLLSALCVAAVLLLVYRLALVYLHWRVALLVAVVSTAGSSLVSTLSTGLWNSDYGMVFGCLALLALVRYDTRKADRLGLVGVGLWLALAVLCRPAMAFLVLAVLAYLAFDPLLARLRHVFRAALVLVALVVAASFFGFEVPVAGYHSPAKLFEGAPGLPEILGTLVSPSRGLIVTSPFLIVVLLGVALLAGRLRREKMFWLMLGWIAVHVMAVAARPVWWGGHSYGARLLVEIIPAFVILTSLLWRLVARHPRRALVRAVAAGYLLLGSLAIFIHTGQGLFNEWVIAWNERPNVDRHSEVVWSWRFPQALATEASIEKRFAELEWRSVEPYGMGDVFGPRSSQALFLRWHPPKGGWRWSDGQTSELAFELEDSDVPKVGLFELVAGSLGRQQVSVTLNETPLVVLTFDGFEAQSSAHLVELSSLRIGAENRLRFDVPGARSTQTDSRTLGIALRSARLRRLPHSEAGVDFADNVLLSSGFGGRESSHRWTVGQRASILYPLLVVEDGGYVLDVVAGADGEQPVEVWVNGSAMAPLSVTGLVPASHVVEVRSEILLPGAMNVIELAFPEPRSAPAYPRRLGLAFVRARLVPAVPRNR